MNKCEMAGFFDVARPTIGDWERRGAPVSSGDPGAVAEWLCRRDLERAGHFPGRLPELVGEHTRERLSLDARIEGANKMPGDTVGPVKAAVVFGLMLERELLDLPGRIIAEATPETLPEKVYELVLRALASARGEDTATSPALADTRRGRSSPGTGARRGANGKTRKGLTQ